MNQEEARSLITNQIQHTMYKFFQTTIPTQFRLVDYLTSITPLVTKTRFLALRIVSRHSYFVVDVNNLDYNYETAHEVTTPIPVYVLRLSRHVRIFRNMMEDKDLADILAKMHHGHGDDPLHLVDDYTKPVLYDRPRGLFP
ncbi:hypothetical protein BJX99DRAFT_244986 [Aspergillus californicus]